MNNTTKYFYSASTKGFYIDGVNDHIKPQDAIEITKNEYDALMSAQGHFDATTSSFKEIVSDINGKPIIVDTKVVQTIDSLRASEYPPITEFADAWVKNDTVALEAYRQKCLAVKAKYPKV